MSKHAVSEIGITISPLKARRPEILLALLILFLTPGVRAQVPNSNKVGSDYSKEAFVVEKLSTVAKFEGDGTSTRTTTSVIRMQSEAGVQHWGVLSTGYNSAYDQVEIGYVRVRKVDGSVVETPPDSAQDVTSEITRVAPMYSDYHEKHLAVKGLGVGDVLQYQITVCTNTPLIPNHFWFEYDFEKSSIVLDEHVEVDIPKDREVRVKSPDSKPVVTERGDRRVYAWESANHEVEKNDEPRREFPSPDILMSTFRSWEELGHWWSGLEQERAKSTPAIRAKAEELTRNSPTREDKVRALYEYVSTHFRYISISLGIGRYQPHAAAEVLKNEYGDCKDKHTLLASLLQAVGIEAYPALMNSRRHIDPDVPSPRQFDHVITAVPESPGSSKLVWLDTTLEVGPYGYLTFLLRGKPALVISGSQPARMLTTPANPPFLNSKSYEIDATLNDSGVLEGKMRHYFRGDTEIVMRSIFRQTPQSQWKDLIQGIYRTVGFGGEVREIEVGSSEETNAPFSFSNKYTRKDYSDWSNHRITPPLDFLGFPEIREDAKRKQPILLGAPQESTWIARVELPKGYRPSILPAVDVVRDFAEYHSSYRFKDGIFVTEVRIIIKQSEIALTALKDYQSFQKAISEDQNQYTELNLDSGLLVPLGPSSASMFSPSPNPEASRLFEKARLDYQQHDVDTSAAALEQALNLDARYKDAWLLLSDVRMDQGRFDEGLKANRKAIDIDSKDVKSYMKLGRSYEALSRPNDAVKVWQEILKQEPTQKDAQFLLGSGLLNLKRYSEAVPVLEAVAARETAGASDWLKLGEAYLGAGNNDKAALTLKKAGALGSTPETWNEVAYSLAEHNLSLNDARLYAIKAVHAVEDRAVQTSLAGLEMGDIERMRLLPTYWDTLGWIYFRQGEMEKAQRYVEAAWALRQIPVVSEHLAEIYKKQGQMAASQHQAVLAYEISHHPLLVSLRPDAKSVNSNGVEETPAAKELKEMRRTKLGNVFTGKGTADFLVLLAPGGGVEDVKFISGDEDLRALSQKLATLKFKAPLPDDAPVKIVRRGVLLCAGSTLGCDFTLFTVDSFRSTN